MYIPCDKCNKPVDNDLTFHRKEPREPDEFSKYTWGWHQYGLCNKHLPRWQPRVFIWTHNIRVGRKVATALGLGYGLMGCLKCDTPYDCIKSHCTYYNFSEKYGSYCSGVHALCEPCWAELSVEERLPYYNQLVDYWINESSYSRAESESKRNMILDSVRKGL